jgi:hypothetical protein
MKLNQSPRIPTDPVLTRELREHATLVNLITEGRLTGTNNAQSTAPTVGEYAQGDFVRNSTPTELGSSPNKYVVLGFLCVASGTPGTFVPVRALTGN